MSTPGEGGRVGTSPAGGGTAGRPAARPRRRGGGPEASSATATIVAVTTSDRTRQLILSGRTRSVREFRVVLVVRATLLEM